MTGKSANQGRVGDHIMTSTGYRERCIEGQTMTAVDQWGKGSQGLTMTVARELSRTGHDRCNWRTRLEEVRTMLCLRHTMTGSRVPSWTDDVRLVKGRSAGYGHIMVRIARYAGR